MRHDRNSPAGWKAGIVVDVLVPVLIGAAILAFVIVIFAASSARAYSSTRTGSRATPGLGGELCG